MKILVSLVSSVRSANSVLARRLAFPLLLLGAGLVLVPPCPGAPFVFQLTGGLIQGRVQHTATLLENGKVLVAGGFNHRSDPSSLASAELYDPATGTWTNTGQLAIGRGGHTATLLPNGMVLVAGGETTGGATASVELYDPASGTWTATGSLNHARAAHTATLLPNGMVLVAGGLGIGIFVATAELYDSASGTWTETGSLNHARAAHTATLLPNGMVLVAAGEGVSGGAIKGAELYDPASGTWTDTGSLRRNRIAHTATLLQNGRVLVAGGISSSGSINASAELYDSASGTWTATGSLVNAREAHTATLLPNGKVLVAGGAGNGDFRGVLASAELYDPATGAWVAAGSHLINARLYHTATLLPDGNVLFAAGGDASTQPFRSAELGARR